jgi:hypothetical protein
MTRPLKDRETGEPAQNISLTITRPRLEWLRNLAAAKNTSMSGAVELLIDRGRKAAQPDSSRAADEAVMAAPRRPVASGPKEFTGAVPKGGAK